MACHTFNMPFAALDLRDPTAVQAETSGHNGDSYPKWSIIAFDFPANAKRGPVKAFWYDGQKKAPIELFESARWRNHISSSGALLVGTKGKLYSPGDYCAQFVVSEKLVTPKVEYVKSPGHFEEWVRAIKGGAPAMSNFPEYAGPLTETILLGNLAVWVAATGKGEKIEWDPKELKVKNIAGLEPIIQPVYRPGYSL